MAEGRGGLPQPAAAQYMLIGSCVHRGGDLITSFHKNPSKREYSQKLNGGLLNNIHVLETEKGESVSNFDFDWCHTVDMTQPD